MVGDRRAASSSISRSVHSFIVTSNLRQIISAVSVGAMGIAEFMQVSG